MRPGRGTHIDPLFLAFSAAVTAILAWLASLLDPLDRIGATTTADRVGVVLLVATAVLARHLYLRHARLLALLETKPRPLCAAEPAVLGARESELAALASRDRKIRYIPRNNDDALEEMLRAKRVIILIGDSGSGKSSSARAMACRVAPNAPVFVPKKPAADLDRPLTAALELMVRSLRWRRRSGWLWLDDLGRYLDRDAVDPSLVLRWLDGNPNRRVVATLNSKDRNRLRTDPAAAGESATALLDMAGRHSVDPTWAGAELERAAHAYPGAGGACAYLGRYLSSGDYHVARFRDAEAACPSAGAILRAAADWRRARLSQPIPEAWLRGAFEVYLSAMPMGADLGELFNRGLAWATDPGQQREAVLRCVPGAEARFEIAEAAVEEAVRRDREISPRLWDLLLEQVGDSADAVAVAVAARAHDRSDVATSILERLLENQMLTESLQILARDAWNDLRHSEPSMPGLMAAASPIARGGGTSATEGSASRNPSWLLSSIFARPGLWATVRVAVLLAIDALGLWSAMMASYVLTDLSDGVALGDARRLTDDRIAYVILLVVLLFARSGLYGHRGLRGNAARVLAAITQAALIFVLLRTIAGPQIGSYELIGTSFLFACITVTGARGAFNRLALWASLRARGGPSRWALVGTRDEVTAVADALGADNPAREIVGFIGPVVQGDDASGALTHLGTTEQLEDVVFVHELDELVLCANEMTEAVSTAIADAALVAGCRLRRLTPGEHFLVAVSRYTPGEPLPLDELRLPVFDGVASARKRAFDLAVTVLLMAASAPVYLVVGLAIKVTSRGPMIQELSYPGLHGVTFGMRKFRVSHVLADRSKAGPPTTVGSIVQRLGIDELPQLLNVLRGEMSLVGPRPISPTDFERLAEWQYNRYLIRPGITGLWQISGRRDRTFAPMVRLDLFYVQHWSIFLDIEIMLKTAAVTLKGNRAVLEVPEVGETMPTHRERRAGFAPGILNELPARGVISFGGVLEVAQQHGGARHEVLQWLSQLDRKGWLEMRLEDHRGGEGPFLGLTEAALAHLGKDPRGEWAAA